MFEQLFNYTFGSKSIHPRRSGPGRSVGMKPKQGKSGSKVVNKAFNGMCTIRGHVGAAGRLALEGKLNSKSI